ncbi:MAG: alpha/beta fold hydrolase [Actinomycetota bacterium]|nr:alpha/beta fold hydrolase [Actinomycetota bacterium]
MGFKCPTCSGGAPARGRGGGRRLVVATAAMAVIGAGLLLSRVVGGGDPTAPAGGPSPAASATSTERPVQFEGAEGLSLGATLGLPPGAGIGDDRPGVVILPGFGPTDRNGLYPPGRPADPLYRDLSAALLDEGMVTFRYDKRGTGQSALPPGEPLRLDDMVGDAASAVDFLADRAEVDPERIAVVGHEEGGLVALRLAASDPRVAGLVLVSVPGRPLVEVVAEDFRNSGHGEDVQRLDSVVAALLAGEQLPAPEALPPSLRDFFPLEQQEYLRDIFSVNPVMVARDVDVPALVVRGEQATGISAADADALVAALGDEAQAVAVPDAGHTLLRMPAADADGEPSGHASDGHGGPAAAFGQREEEALARIREFLGSVLG